MENLFKLRRMSDAPVVPQGKYVKLIDEHNYTVAPKVFYDGDIPTVGFTAEFLLSKGYKLLVEEYCSDEQMIPVYTETETEIIEHWQKG